MVGESVNHYFLYKSNLNCINVHFLIINFAIYTNKYIFVL